jgi:cytochrome c5
MTKALLAVAILVSGTLAADLAQAQAKERTGEQIVKQQCIKCHGSGVSGAPKIDDRAAWSKRMGNGLQATVASAMKGHGKMPARGGIANLSDTELRAAILYMFYPAGALAQGASPAAPAEPADPHRKVVDGMEVFLGIAPAGSGSYHVNISLRDAASKAPIKDAAVEARVANPLGGTSKKLAPKTFNDAPGFVNDFRMEGRDTYTITAQIRRPGNARPSEVQFDFKP